MPKLASRQSAFIVLFLLCISVSFSNTGVHALPATTEFTLNGLVASPGTYNLADLQASTRRLNKCHFNPVPERRQVHSRVCRCTAS